MLIQIHSRMEGGEVQTEVLYMMYKDSMMTTVANLPYRPYATW